MAGIYELVGDMRPSPLLIFCAEYTVFCSDIGLIPLIGCVWQIIHLHFNSAQLFSKTFNVSLWRLSQEML